MTKQTKPDSADVSDVREQIKKKKVSTRPIQPKITEQLMFKEQSRMFFKLRSIAKRLEEEALDETKSPAKLVYSLSTIYSQQREVIADIRSVQDMGAQLQSIDMEVFDPLRRNLTNNLTSVMYQFKSLLSNVCKEGEMQFALTTLTSLMTDLGSGLDDATTTASLKMQQVLMPEEQPMQRKRKRK